MKESLKKLFIIPLAASFLLSCGTDQSSSIGPKDDSSNSQVSSSSEETSSSSIDESSSSTSKEPEVIRVEGVTLNKTSLEMHIGESETLLATVSPENANDKSLTWTSSNDAVASINEGRVVALSAGEATITVTTTDGGKTATCAVIVLEDTFAFNISTSTGNVKTLSKDVNYDLVQSDSIQLDVIKNGSEWFDADIVTTVTGDSGVISSVNEKEDVDNCYNVVFAGNNGSATIEFKLAGHEDLGSLTVTYNVTQYFLNQTIKRANVSEADGKIAFDGTGQHTAVVKKADTNWVLKATLGIKEYTGNNSVGLGGFTDNGDHALWFSLRNFDEAADNIEGIYLLDFYSGWDSRKDIATPAAYQNLEFKENEAGDSIVVDFELIRNGLEYYYNIGGYHGKYTSSFEGASYAGFFSQEKETIITNYSIEYGEEAATSAIGDDYGENAKIDAGVFTDPNVNEIVRGESREFNVNVAPSYSTEAYKLEASEEYAEYVEISGTKITIKEDAPKGNMTLVLKSDSGKVLDSITLPVEETSSEKSNEQLTAKGGVILNDDGSIVFPESKIGIDGVGSEDKYRGDIEYGATLKQTVLGGDFSIEFDVSDYKTTARYPKLMVSVGGDKSQFYLAYGYDNTEASRFETKTYSAENYGDDWNNTEDFANFDRNATHHFKIESKNGYYNFYVDGGEALAQKCGDSARNIVVPMGTYYKQMPVRFSTNGVSAKISNIQVTSGNIEDLEDLHTFGNRASKVDENAVQSTMPVIDGDSWACRYKTENGMFSSKLFASLTGAYKVSFDVTFSKSMENGKLAICFGNHEFHICNAGNGSKLENYPGHWGGPSVGNIALGTLTIRITIENDGNGTVKVSLPLNDGTTGSVTDSGVTPTSGIHFYVFNDRAADADTIVTIGNIVIE